MTKLELLCVLLPVKALLDCGDTEKAKELVDQIIETAREDGTD